MPPSQGPPPDSIFTGAVELIAEHEGLLFKPYRCPSGYLTIGYGRNLDTRGITSAEADMMLANDVRFSIQDLERVFPNWRKISEKRKVALVDLNFWLGTNKFKSFSKMIAAIKKNDFVLAAQELFHSKLLEQSPMRTNELYRMLLEKG